MKRIKTILTSAATGLLTAALALNFNACTQQSPVASNTDSFSNQKEIEILKLNGNKSTQTLNKRVVVSTTVTPAEGGHMFLKAGADADLLLLIKKKPPLSSSRLARELMRSSPLSSAVLIAAIDRSHALQSGHLLRVLLKNAPLSESVLQSAIDRRALNEKCLTKVLIKSSPLPPAVLDQVENLGLTRKQLRNVMRAQNGQRHEEAEDDQGGTVFVQMIVPPGAVDETIELSVGVDDEELSGNVFLAFGPHGTVFNVPITLNMEIHGLDLSEVEEDELNIYYVNPETGQWEVMQARNIIVKKHKGYIKVIGAQLPHFSRYAIGME